MGRRIAMLAGLLAMAAGCFKPDRPACAFSCATPPHTCPQGFVCGEDNLCHDPNSAGVCTIMVTDAAPDDGSSGDAGPGDARTDARTDAGTDAGAGPGAGG